MGKRARKGGIANKAVRIAKAAAAAAQKEQDAEAATIAQRVYAVAMDPAVRAVELPLQVYAPVRMASELAGVGLVRAYGLAGPPGSKEELEEIALAAAYMCEGFFAMLTELDREHYENWKEEYVAR